MSDDHLADELNDYAAHLHGVGRLPTPVEIRQLASRRRQRKAVTATFGLVLVGMLGLGFAVTRTAGAPPSSTPTPPAPTPSRPSDASPSTGASPSGTSSPSSRTPEPGASSGSQGPPLYSSDVSVLKRLGVEFNVGVLIDVADDGLDRYMEVGPNGVVDFTGTSRTDNTMMALKPARVPSRTDETKNRVVIAPPFYNEDLGPGQCVTDTAPGVLKLQTCEPGSAAQTWQVYPAGDSGQFELHGPKTVIRVNEGKITSGEGYVGLQTITFAD
ncbi:hypothetical protein E0H26_13015 [Micromonospora zingiberis]|uniref:Uncharacterized protein n=1 Tax=Micromonospora zingiberis TaxID=2053011 RepID=A0A4R0GIF6_9ACTN|nr:hypothetical protein [Micromonospora zingiberis]TCB97190.1 hypothetical protein E0H26_13015 [Micromonospora zingiberis]